MKTIAIVQARMGSARLPGKVLLPLRPRETALGFMLERVKAAKSLDKIVVATSTDSGNNDLISYLERLGISYFAGSETDVLDRYYQTAKMFAEPDDLIVRLTGDCPLHDPRVIDLVVNTYFSGNYDFVSNSLEPYSFPDGLDVEVFSFKNLETAWHEAKLPSHREHVTFYFWQNPARFKIFYVKNPQNLSRYRLTLDYPEDYELIKNIVSYFAGQKKQDFSMAEIIAYLDLHPEVMMLNAGIKQNAGWEASLQADKQFLNN